MRKEKPTCEPCNPAGSEVSSNRIGGISEEEEKKQKQKQCKEPQKDIIGQAIVGPPTP